MTVPTVSPRPTKLSQRSCATTSPRATARVSTACALGAKPARLGNALSSPRAAKAGSSAQYVDVDSSSTLRPHRDSASIQPALDTSSSFLGSSTLARTHTPTEYAVRAYDPSANTESATAFVVVVEARRRVLEGDDEADLRWWWWCWWRKLPVTAMAGGIGWYRIKPLTKPRNQKCVSLRAVLGVFRSPRPRHLASARAP